MIGTPLGKRIDLLAASISCSRAALRRVLASSIAASFSTAAASGCLIRVDAVGGAADVGAAALTIMCV